MLNSQVGGIEVTTKRLDLSIPHREHIAYRHGSGFALGSGEIEVELYRDPIARFGIANDLAIEIHTPTQHGRILLPHFIRSLAKRGYGRLESSVFSKVLHDAIDVSGKNQRIFLFIILIQGFHDPTSIVPKAKERLTAS